MLTKLKYNFLYFLLLEGRILKGNPTLGTVNILGTALFDKGSQIAVYYEAMSLYEGPLTGHIFYGYPR